jgi:hypothetical protein
MSLIQQSWMAALVAEKPNITQHTHHRIERERDKRGDIARSTSFIAFFREEEACSKYECGKFKKMVPANWEGSCVLVDTAELAACAGLG